MRNLTVIAILIIALIAAYALPKEKYKSPDTLSKLEIPMNFSGWKGEDLSNRLDFGDERYNFISKGIAKAYTNQYGESLLLLVLDAGNFHHPKVCFGSAGFKVKELADIRITTQGNSFKAKALYAQNPKEEFLLVYWICINEEVVDWTNQKLKQLWFSLFNKEKTGLMVRIDIPTSEADIASALKLAEGFIRDLNSDIVQEQAAYIFGKAKLKTYLNLNLP